jgi:hypothetical protein
MDGFILRDIFFLFNQLSQSSPIAILVDKIEISTGL